MDSHAALLDCIEFCGQFIFPEAFEWFYFQDKKCFTMAQVQLFNILYEQDIYQTQDSGSML